MISSLKCSGRKSKGTIIHELKKRSACVTGLLHVCILQIAVSLISLTEPKFSRGK